MQISSLDNDDDDDDDVDDGNGEENDDDDDELFDVFFSFSCFSADFLLFPCIFNPRLFLSIVSGTLILSLSSLILFCRFANVVLRSG